MILKFVILHVIGDHTNNTCLKKLFIPQLVRTTPQLPNKSSKLPGLATLGSLLPGHINEKILAFELLIEVKTKGLSFCHGF